MLDPEVQRLLNEKGSIIRDKLRPEEIVLFGSRAQGTARPDSDIDLIITSSVFQNIPLVNRMGYFLNTVKFTKHIDAICLTPKELEIRKQSPLFLELYRSGVPVTP